MFLNSARALAILQPVTIPGDEMNATDALTRRIVMLIAWVGAVAFSALLALACFKPAAIESWARQAVTAQVQERLALHAPEGLVRAAARLAVRNPARPGGLRTRMESAYAEMTRGLIREVRIFSGANALVFLVLGLIAVFWTRAGRQLLVPATVLLGAALLVGCTYAFNQDWLHTILLGDYVGLWYFSYLLVAIAFMLDVVFNRARTTMLLVFIVTSVVGAAVTAVS